jgi:hypothetical protein
MEVARRDARLVKAERNPARGSADDTATIPTIFQAQPLRAQLPCERLRATSSAKSGHSNCQDKDSVELQSRSEFVVIHPGEVVLRVHVPCPTEEELVERFHGAATQ